MSATRLPMTPPRPISQTSPADQVSYGDLYTRWERGNWRATELDFSQDRVHWREQFSELERRSALWNYALFFHGEDSVADNLSPCLDAAPREEQKYFLATQQVDEARHAVFFDRFMREVVQVGGDGSIAGSLHATGPELTWGFRRVFGRLDRMADELRQDRSRPKLAQAIALYHFVIEASLAQPGQHFIERYLDERKLLPGFHEGIRNVSLDEQRHIAFGVKLVSDLIAEDPECVDAIVELMNEVIPYTTAVLVPPDWDESYIECFGITLEELYEDAAASLEAKLRAAGVPPEAMDRMSLPFDLSPRERVRRALTLLRANMLGEKLGPVSRDPHAVEVLFEAIRRQADPRVVPSGATLQWEFDDFEPWYLLLDNGTSRVQRGRAPEPDVTLRCRFEDWIDVVARRADPRSLLLRRRLRPRGRLRLLVRLPRLFGAGW